MNDHKDTNCIVYSLIESDSLSPSSNIIGIEGVVKVSSQVRFPCFPTSSRDRNSQGDFSSFFFVLSVHITTSHMCNLCGRVIVNYTKKKWIDIDSGWE